MSVTALDNYVPIESNGNSIVFISDLHFGITKKKFKAKAAVQMKDEFIKFVKDQFDDSIICLAGDFFNDYRITLAFVKELEQNKIFGFFVLGNHDFWNNGRKSYNEIISIFDAETEANQYFRFLTTDKKYYINDICFIGDTGWTSFRRKKQRVGLQQFTRLPDAKEVKGFSPKEIIDMHDKWVAFANSVLRKENKVLMLTHFPMTDFTKEDYDCWWSSQTNIKGENCWRIFGHTHSSKQQKNNNVSSQRGYNNKDMISLKTNNYKQYSLFDFGKLEKVIYQSGITVRSYDIISKYYSTNLVTDTNAESSLISAINGRGYKRCAANKKALAHLADSPKEYINEVKQITEWYLKDTYMGYTLKDSFVSNSISKNVIELINSSISILENGNTTDIRAFITAAVITGYVYNEMPFLIETMRPLDSYDIIRFWLMFLTIKQYGVDIDSIESVCRHKKSNIEFNNVNIYLPVVNGYSLTINEVQELMKQTPLLHGPDALLK